MQLEDYFEFHTEPVESIRIKGTRIRIDLVIELYRRYMTPEQIAVHFGCPISVEQAYATILYYLHNRAEVDAYLARGEARWEQQYREYLAKEPPEVVKRVKALKAARSQAS
jgi:uncharacterized protein (DUF433 family)